MILAATIDIIFFSIIFAVIILLGCIYLVSYIYNQKRKEISDVICEEKNNEEEDKENSKDGE